MKKFFLFAVSVLFFSSQLNAATREFSSIEEAQSAATAAARNKEIMENGQFEERLPTTDEEMFEYIQKRKDYLDIMPLPEGDTLDKMSSFSRVDDVPPEENKSTWEKIYDNAMSKLSGSPGVNADIHPVEYYSLKEETEENSEEEVVPIITLQLPNGVPLKAAALEHIPYFATQIEVLPNRMLQVDEHIVVVANGRKVKEPLARFIRKRPLSGKGKISLILGDVVVNGTSIPYEVVERRDYYVIRPQKRALLPEGAYVFEFKYVVDRSLLDYGDFYELYWNLTGGSFNLLVERAIISLRLPGREPATKYYALTGNSTKLNTKNAVVTQGKNNIMGFMNLYPLMNGESLHIFLTIPKVDFLPETVSYKAVNWLESWGDMVLSAIYFVIVFISCLLSWRYIRKNLKFKKVTISSVLLLRALWRGGTDIKSVGCVILDLFRKNLIDIEERDKEIILVRKMVHARHLSKFDRKLLGFFFSKKDSICRLSSGRQMYALKSMIQKKADKGLHFLGLRLSGMYILFNALMLLAVETGLILWNSNSALFLEFLLADIWLFFMAWIYLAMKNTWIRKVLVFIMFIGLILFSVMFLSVYLCWQAITLLLLAICVSIVFCKKVAGPNAMLKNAVQSAYQMREFLLEQKEYIENGKNFSVQQPNIFALDLEDKYSNNPKIKNSYRLDMIKSLIRGLS